MLNNLCQTFSEFSTKVTKYMSSVTKTLQLLAYFSAKHPEIGLSQLCRMAKRDKATTYRHLQALETAGFVEQNPSTKQYRLGPALLPLAQTREMTVPRKAGLKQVLQTLSDATGETSHVTVLSGSALYELINCESQKHSTRVVVDITTFPLHSTSSGLCALAFGPDELTRVAKQKLARHTKNTPVDPNAVDQAVRQARQLGFGRSLGAHELDVYSLAAPIFDATGHFAGAVAVACVASRFTDELERTIRSNLVTASREITRKWGGTIPRHVEHAWGKTLQPS